MDQIKKNTVDVSDQVILSDCIRLEHLREDTKLRVLFVGNSITLHGYLPEIGWEREWGMAASAREKDYVHLCKEEIMKMQDKSAVGICQVWQWEKGYKNGESYLPLYKAAREFGADVIVMRAVENCSPEGFEEDTFIREYDKLIRYLDPEGKAEVILTTSFWKHPSDQAIRVYAEKEGFPCIYLGDLGELDEMKAIGLFQHTGVANHPGDLGMKTIAERIMQVMKERRFLQ